MLVVVIVAMLAAAAVAYFVGPYAQRSAITAAASAAADKQLTPFKRIKRDGLIRAGYVSNPPSCAVDPNTGKVGGIFVDAMEEIASNAGLKIKWVEEVGFGSMIEGLNVGRYDMVPCAIWPTSARAKYAAFSHPLFYSGVGAYVRAGDHRFDHDLEALNNPSIKIATIDGEMAAAIASSDFPKAQQVALPQLSDISTMLLNVKDGKADATFVEKYFAEEFLKNNPGSIKRVGDKLVRVFPDTVLVKLGDEELLGFLNTAIEGIDNQGVIRRLLKKYEPSPGTYLPLTPPYQEVGVR
jgi:polar amino acid transport system substrate-binding protein